MKKIIQSRKIGEVPENINDETIDKALEQLPNSLASAYLDAINGEVKNSPTKSEFTQAELKAFSLM